MNRTGRLVAMALILSSSAAPLRAQAADSATAAVVGARAGREAGRVASVSGARWGSAAATFFLTPFVGGTIVLVKSAQDPSGVPDVVPPAAVPPASMANYQQAYRDAYRAEYLPRRRRAMRSAMIGTSVVFLVAVAALSG